MVNGLSQNPHIAFRGLWDRFAAPGSTGALRRAWIKGVSAIARVPSEVSVEDLTRIFLEPVHGRKCAAFFVETGGTADLSPLVSLPGAPAVFIFPALPRTAPRKLYRLVSGGSAEFAGFYMPISFLLGALEQPSSGFSCAGTTDLVLFEATDTLVDLADQRDIRHVTDTALRQLICRALTPNHLIQVCDLVELELLLAQPPSV